MTVTEELSKQSESKPSFFSLKPLVQGFRKAFVNKQVPLDALNQYVRALSQMRMISPVIRALDNEKMHSEEFLLFIELQKQVINSSGEYEGLNISISLLAKAIERAGYIKKIARLELASTSQIEKLLHDHIGDLLAEFPDRVHFQDDLRQKIDEITSRGYEEEITQKIIESLRNYVVNLEKITQDDRGLELLYLIKKYNVLQTLPLQLDVIFLILHEYETGDILNLENLIQTVRINYDVFRQIGIILGIPKDKSSPENYGKIIQYLILRYKYQEVFVDFQRLSELLFQWLKPYQTVLKIQEQYSPYEYKQPKEFAEAIPCLDIYQRYRQVLTD